MKRCIELHKVPSGQTWLSEILEGKKYKFSLVAHHKRA